MIAKNIKQAMAAIGITQLELCEKMGISTYGVRAGIERGTLPIGHVYGCGTKHKAFYISPYKLQQGIGVNVWD